MTSLTLNIVSLDDDPDFREYVDSSLSRQGHRVRAVGTPEEFFTTCEADLPDVMLLDLDMGAHSGTEVLDEVRVRWPDVCVVIITGHPSLESMRDTFKKQAFDYIPKPFQIDQLTTVLGNAAESLSLGRTPLERLRERLGRGIRLARNAEGWTLKDLSERSGVSVSQLSSIERGTHLPSLESLVAIASALDARASDWLAGAGL